MSNRTKYNKNNYRNIMHFMEAPDWLIFWHVRISIVIDKHYV